MRIFVRERRGENKASIPLPSFLKKADEWKVLQGNPTRFVGSGWEIAGDKLQRYIHTTTNIRGILLGKST